MSVLNIVEAGAPIWLWLVFAVVVVSVLYLDLCVFHKHSSEPKFSETLRICASYIGLAVLFGLFICYEINKDTGFLFYTGYLVEFSLSMDNIFVISLVFTSMKIPRTHQHRVLFWGVMGAIILRAVMILLGASLIAQFHWILYVFSVFLIFTGVKMLFHDEDEADLTEGKLFQFVRKHLRATKHLTGEKFWVRKFGKLYATPLLLTLIIIEIMDVIFAVDSIPAIFLITNDTFVVYTSNIFAILGLRSLYFLLAEAVNRFKYLKQSLSIILIFIGSKIFFPFIGFKVIPAVSLSVTFALLAGGIILSLIKTQKQPS